jgi:hypothetical protein
MDESAGKALKRRGLMAGAAALVAGIAAQRASQPVGATSGGGPDGPLVMGSNFGSGGTPNTISRLTVQVPTGTWSGSTAAMFGVDAVVAGNAPADTTALYGVGKGGGAGLLGAAGVTPANVTALNAGVYGIGSGGKTGVRGASDTGIGVAGEIPSTSTANGTYAVQGFNKSSGAGGYGVRGDCPSGTGVLGQSTAGVGVYGATVSGLYGVVGASGSSSGSAGLLGVATGPNAIGFGTIAQGGATFAGYFNGTTVVNGAFAVTGSKSAAVKDANGEYRLMYSVESPEAWFEDFGTGTLVSGTADVKLDPLFAQLVRTDQYHVFLTPHDEEHHLAVKARAGQGFIVAASASVEAAAKGKKASDLNGTFSYRIVAKRADITGERLATFTMPPKLVVPEPPDAPRMSPDTIIGGPVSKESAPDGTGPLPAPPSRPTQPAPTQPGPAPQNAQPSPVQPVPPSRP